MSLSTGEGAQIISHYKNENKTIRWHFTITVMAKIKKKLIPNISKDVYGRICRVTRTLICCWLEHKGIQTFGKLLGSTLWWLAASKIITNRLHLLKSCPYVIPHLECRLMLLKNIIQWCSSTCDEHSIRYKHHCVAHLKLT